MILAVVVMFNALRQAAIIWLTAPLALIGVTVGLLVFQAPFEFMAILGFLSLIGMMVKNAIVLVDQIDAERRAGKALEPAIIDSAVSRMMPVSLGALTTILGVAPLLMDPFFRSMTVVIMFGLALCHAPHPRRHPALLFVVLQAVDGNSQRPLVRATIRLARTGHPLHRLLKTAGRIPEGP
jgi:multidrug efflux pump subunit AcrB